MTATSAGFASPGAHRAGSCNCLPQGENPAGAAPAPDEASGKEAPQWRPRAEDQEFFDREVAEFLPDRVFDAHTHLYRRDHTAIESDRMPSNVGFELWRDMVAPLHGDRTRGALFIPFPPKPEKGLVDDANRWIAQHTPKNTPYRGLFFVTPDDDPEWVRQEVRRLGLVGLKCYHTFAHETPTWDADIPAYLPEPIVKVAGEEGWVITLHMVKRRAVAEPSNIHWIRRYCETYPDMKLILAHSARGFQPAHNLEGLSQLTGLENLYFDTSANCEPIAHQSIFRVLGHRNVLYGSDVPASHDRGRSVAAADSFLWLYGDTPVWGEKHAKIRPVLVGLEHLRSLKWACWAERLSDTAVEDIFWNNAARLFNIG